MTGQYTTVAFSDQMKIVLMVDREAKSKALADLVNFPHGHGRRRACPFDFMHETQRPLVAKAFPKVDVVNSKSTPTLLPKGERHKTPKEPTVSYTAMETPSADVYQCEEPPKAAPKTHTARRGRKTAPRRPRLATTPAKPVTRTKVVVSDDDMTEARRAASFAADFAEFKALNAVRRLEADKRRNAVAAIFAAKAATR